MIKHLLQGVTILMVGCIGSWTFAAEPVVYLRRSVDHVREKPDDLSADKVHYRPLFGAGDERADVVKGIVRFGEVTIEAGGTSKLVSYENEEQAYFIISGSGMVLYGDDKVAIKPNDFLYLPIGVKHGLANFSAEPLRVLVMGYRIPQGRQVPPVPKLMLANSDDVPLQVLGQHGPTTQFRLLLGNSQSTRDKIAAGLQITSLFMMDFAPGGTNIPHTHPREEEIYYVLRGAGDMVAGGTQEKPARYVCKAGDAFYFPPGTLIGFYSGAREGQPHDLIVAVRSPYPASATTRPGN